MIVVFGAVHCYVKQTGWRIFDYRDTLIAFRVAERFDCFPYKVFDGWAAYCENHGANEDATQLAIALSVIEAKE